MNEKAKPELTKLDTPERSRTYRFPDGETVTINSVTHFLERDSGTHRLKTASGRLWIVPKGWLAIEIDADGWSL